MSDGMDDATLYALREYEAAGGTVRWSDCTRCKRPEAEHTPGGYCPLTASCCDGRHDRCGGSVLQQPCACSCHEAVGNRTLDEKLGDVLGAAAAVVDATDQPPIDLDGLARTHIAGLNLSVKAQQTRQRCAWCGTALVDEWRAPGAPTLLGVDGQPIDQAAMLYPIGSLVRIDPQGARTPIPGPLPHDFCGFLDQRLRDAPSPAQAPT